VKNLFLFLIFTFYFFANPSQAQFWGCFDSLSVITGGFCLPDYEPVCACNNKTYKNFCYARIEGYQLYQDGICEPVDFNILTNPVLYNLELDIIVRETDDVRLWIFDWNGKIYHQDFFPFMRRRKQLIDVNNFKQGIYLVVVQTSNSRVVKRFIKVSQ
jgi:hypothetical protein